jgi:hypothetical protein
MMTVAAITVTAGISQRTGKRGGSVRHLVSVTTVWRCPANQSSALLTAVIFFRAIQKQPRSAATTSTRMSLVGHHDRWPCASTAATVQPTPMAAVRQK